MSNRFAMRRPSRRVTAVTATAALIAPLWTLAGSATAAAPRDTTPPVVTLVTVTPSPIPAGTASVALTAHAADEQPGKVASASYTLNGGPAVAMQNDSPDGMFNNKDEDVQAIINASALGVGNYQLCVSATDDSGNDSVTAECTTLVVAPPPDTSVPSVTINQGASQDDPTSSSPVTFDVVFSEPVTGFGDADVVLGGTAGATTATVTGSGATYSVAVSGMTSDGTVTASVGAGAATDGTNASAASTSTDNTVRYDATAPTVTINQAATQSDPTRTQPIVFDVVFSEPVIQYQNDADDFVITGPAGATGTIGDAGDADARTYTVSVSGLTTDGVVSVTVPAGAAFDAAGNASAASTSTDNSVTYDATAPAVTVNQAAAQSDPTSVQPIVFDVAFTETVTGFDAADVVLGGTATGGTATVNGSGATYTISVSGITADGTVTADIVAGAAVDGVGNASTASTSTDNSVTYDDVDFSVAVSRTEVNQGDSVTMSGILTDADGSTTDVTAETVFSSDVATDVVAGNMVTFPTASPHTITGTHVPTTDTDSVVVEVTALQVGGVKTPQGGETGGGSEGSGGSGGSEDSDGVVDGEFLPHTGAGLDPLALGFAGLLLLTAGGVVTRTALRRRAQVI